MAFIFCRGSEGPDSVDGHILRRVLDPDAAFFRARPWKRSTARQSW